MGTYKFRIRKYHKSLSQALNIHLFGSESLQEHSESYKQAFREHSEHSEQLDCVIPSEPKILRLFGSD